MRILSIATTLALISIFASQQANAYPKVTHYPNVMHSYELQINDIDGKPIEGVDVLFSTHVIVSYFDDNKSELSKTRCVTDANGVCKVEFEAAPRCNPITKDTFVSFTSMSCGTEADDDAKGYVHEYSEVYQSSVIYTATKEGFYTGSSGKLSSSLGTYGRYDPNEKPVKVSVSLYKPVDYFSEAFVKSAAERKLREQALKFISLIRARSSIVDADIMPRSTGMSVFKGKKYFQMKVNTTNVYNSLKLDKYGIAKRLFDDSIRKILDPLNENISNPKAFYGYDLIIYGHTKSFADDSASPVNIEYRFLIPQNTVKRYKDKDISGQQVLDASVILMNDERIELKLQ